MATATISCTWRSSHTVELPEGVTAADLDRLPFGEWPEDVLEALDTGGAYLSDWHVS